MTVGQKLRTLRTMRGITQEELSKLTNIPTNYLSMMETGRVIPAGEWDFLLREALGWTPEMDARLDQIQEIAS